MATAHTARGAIEIAASIGDEVTADIASGRLMEQEKTAWMLRSPLK